MALPSSGAISLSQIRNEFSLGSGQIAMSQLRSRGNAPASGAVIMGSHFHGVSAVTYMTLNTTVSIGHYSQKAGISYTGFKSQTSFVDGNTNNFGSIANNAPSGTSSVITNLFKHEDVAGAFVELKFNTAHNAIFNNLIINGVTFSYASRASGANGNFHWNVANNNAFAPFSSNAGTNTIVIN